MKKILMIGMALLLVGCSNQTQAETAFTTTTIETTVAETTTAADNQASKEIEVMESLESEGRVIYDDESGDIIEVVGNPEETQAQILEVLREEVRTGKLTDGEIDDTVRVVCDFLDEEKQNEFISELHSLVPQPAATTAPQSQSQPKETKSATQSKESKPQETQSQPVETEPVYSEPVQSEPGYSEPEYTETEQTNNNGKIDTSGWDLGGGSVKEKPLDTDQNLTPGEIADIESVDFN